MSEYMLQFSLTEPQAREIQRILSQEEDALVAKGKYLTPNARDALNAIYTGLRKNQERQGAANKKPGQTPNGGSTYGLRLPSDALHRNKPRYMGRVGETHNSTTRNSVS